MNLPQHEYTRKEAAVYIGKTLSTVNTMATRQKNILPFEKVGNKTYYKKMDLDAYLISKL